MRLQWPEIRGYPRSHGHMLECLDDEPCHFVLIFDNGYFSEFGTFGASASVNCSAVNAKHSCTNRPVIISVSTDLLEGMCRIDFLAARRLRPDFPRSKMR